MNTKALHEKALQVAKRYRRCEIELIEILEKVDALKICYHHGCRSTFRYAVDVLKLSEAVALIFINVSRKTRELPKLRDEIRRGAITVSKAQKMTSVLTQKNCTEWIDRAKKSSTRQLEKAVATENPKVAVKETATYVSRDRLNLQMGVSEKSMLTLRRVQDVLSQKKMRSVSLEEALEHMAAEFLDRYDPVRKARRQKSKGKIQTTLHVKSSGRQPIPAATKHELYLKSGGQCMHSNCQSRRHLEIHHITPVSKNGGNNLENLQLLCSGHHRVVHSDLPSP